ncbi:hypothetical protein ONR57_21125 [Hoyosella sp. YIM 151337]|uniref:hypothetical protein n=1 Tax=Hoyosella sp. YIM 151337 TaxID=2992742 RepID=UPI002235617E|nr:hypothetical protein [Hoyosella sp. YIM 151337]MCW4355811.1 hypothetical protein [Hoyosella sp. YIM 151337]
MGSVLGIAVDARHVRSALRYPDGSCDEQTVPVGSEGVGTAVARAVTLMEEWAGPIRSVVIASPSREPVRAIEGALNDGDRTLQFVDIASAQWAYLQEIGVFMAPGDVILYSLGDNAATVSLLDPESGETLARDYHPFMGQRTIDEAIRQLTGSRHRIEELRTLLADRATAQAGGVTVHRTDVTERISRGAHQSFSAAMQLAADSSRDAKSIYLLGASAVLLAPVAREYRNVPIIVPEDPAAVAAIGAASLVTVVHAAEQTGANPASTVSVVKAARVGARRRQPAVHRRSPNSRRLLMGAAVIALLAGTGLGVHQAATTSQEWGQRSDRQSSAELSRPDNAERPVAADPVPAETAPEPVEEPEPAPAADEPAPFIPPAPVEPVVPPLLPPPAPAPEPGEAHELPGRTEAGQPVDDGSAEANPDHDSASDDGAAVAGEDTDPGDEPSGDQRDEQPADPGDTLTQIPLGF